MTASGRQRQIKNTGHPGRHSLARWVAIPSLTALLLSCDSALEPRPSETPSDSVAAVAFPGAEGFGAHSVGGRGGTIIAVTTLSDHGPGSLRAAVEASGPRTVVFRTGGTILLERKLAIENPYLTLAGQTAPGGGIAISAAGDVGNALVQIRTHDVIVRHLRIRPGFSTVSEGSLGRQALSIEGPDAHFIIVDHVSMSWAEDKALEVFNGARDVTVQWSIMAETLSCANHRKTVSPEEFGTFGDCPPGGEPHSRAVTISAPPSGGIPPDRISLHHNLFAHNNKRHPNATAETLVDFVNNVIYDLGDLGANLGLKSESTGQVRLNYVNNVLLVGPETQTQAGLTAVSAPVNTADNALAVYAGGNLLPPEIRLVPDFFAERGFLAAEPHPAEPVGLHPRTALPDAVISGVGATRPTQDVADARVLEEVVAGTGGFVDTPFTSEGCHNWKPGWLQRRKTGTGCPTAGR